MTTATELGTRELNRALLERQLLLRRRRLPVPKALEHLVGLQAQEPPDPYVALWSRLEGFRPDMLATLITSHKAVRATLMRTTIHLVTARDYLALYSVMRPRHVRTVLSGGADRRALKGLDLKELLSAAHALIGKQPLTRAQLGPLLARRWPDRDPAALARAAAYLLPAIHIPPRGVWGATGRTTLTTAESWLDRSPDRATSPERAVLRYLAAFGPATTADIRTWSGLNGLAAIMERLRPRLISLRDQRGRELLDLPSAPRPSGSTPAPPRFLPEYDNVLLSHYDRSRIVPSEHRQRLITRNGRSVGTVLIDGFVKATWRVRREGKAATLVVELLEPLARLDLKATKEEGARLLGWMAPEADTHRIEVNRGS